MKILDVCCGGRMFYFDKNNPLVEFCDIRRESHELSNGQTLVVDPDTICDFTLLPHANESKDIVIFDPPHFRKSRGEKSWMFKKYGLLETDWQKQITKGFNQCFRVLKENGVLIFKWNETDYPVSEIIKCAPFRPILGHKSGKQSKTHWLLFVKNPAMQ